jgi:hypothetical protein
MGFSLLPEVEHLDQVGVDKRCGDPRFPDEKIPEMPVLRKAGMNDLDGDFLLESLLAG